MDPNTALWMTRVGTLMEAMGLWYSLFEVLAERLGTRDAIRMGAFALGFAVSVLGLALEVVATF